MPKLIYILYCYVIGIIECGSACAAQFNGGCDLYAPKKDSKLCHIGYFDNTDSNYLTGESGTNPVYINLSKALNFC